jgi:NAD(P)-dependent dehydrogenase (short-subunit alcohol dehydrogenase family)
MELIDRVVLVTGAGSGLGAATALACAREGARTFLVDRDAQGMAETAQAIADAGGESASHVADLSQRSTCFQAVAAAVDRFGGLDGLCNVAGITLFHQVCDVTEEEWNLTMAIILSAPFYLSQAAIPELLRSKGSIVNVASSGGIKGTAYTVPYSAAKAGVIHMTKCMAMEFMNQPIRINAIAPGGMITNIARDMKLTGGMDRDLIRRFSGMRPPVDPSEVANVIAFLLSDKASNIHGSIVSVDGGVTAD